MSEASLYHKTHPQDSTRCVQYIFIRMRMGTGGSKMWLWVEGFLCRGLSLTPRWWAITAVFDEAGLSGRKVSHVRKGGVRVSGLGPCSRLCSS